MKGKTIFYWDIYLDEPVAHRIEKGVHNVIDAVPAKMATERVHQQMGVMKRLMSLYLSHELISA